MSSGTACVACLRRTWLIARLAARIERERLGRSGRLSLLLALSDERRDQGWCNMLKH